jgi:hypothetical protein
MHTPFFAKQKMHRRNSLHVGTGILAAMFVFLGSSLFPTNSYAASLTYKGTLTAISAPSLEIKPGEEKQLTVTFKNTGTATWKKSGANFTSLYTQEPKYHASVLRGSDWISSSQTPKISADVAPGKTGTISFLLKAPTKAGVYHERFRLAAEDLAWIDGTDFSISVTVSKTAAGTGATTPIAATPPSPQTPSALAATRLLMNVQRLSLKGGETAEISVLFKNSGTAAWQTRQLVQDVGLRIAAGEVPTFADASWPSQTVALSVTEPVTPGKTVYVKFPIKAPAERGEYSAQFKLIIDAQEVSGGTFQIPVTVTDDAPGVANLQPGPTASGISPTATLIQEPILRVGIDTVPVKSLILSSTSNLSVKDANNAILGTIPAGLAATLTIGTNGAFSLTGANIPLSLSGIIRFVPDAADLAATSVSAGGAESWSSWADGNRYRGTVEIRYYAPADVTWVINELPIEKYLYGIAEMSNDAPIEYQKALITAARTYAYWHLQNPGKHITFTVDSTYDQVYRAFNRELKQPNTVAAVEATRGAIVHYGGVPVVTPYYANSDGRTRAWTEVWGGAAKPWLVSVPAIYDIGKTLWGHGVGMSAQDAVQRDAKDGWKWDQLLKYYYTGIEIKKVW